MKGLDKMKVVALGLGMLCFVCCKKLDSTNTALAYSLESGMCQTCYENYKVWAKENGIEEIE